jgi:TctA family transporter
MLCAIVTGILTGLLPALPIYTAPFLLYYFNSSLPVEYLMVFWLVAVSGSQFFGSIAAISTKIPGEESSTVYLNDLNLLSQDQRNSLLYDTALGSAVAGLLSLVFVYLIITYTKASGIMLFSSMNFQIVCYSLAILSFCLFNKNIPATLGLVILGLVLSPKNNYSLPHHWFEIQSIFSGFTFYMVVLGTAIIPELFFNSTGQPENTNSTAVNNKKFSLVQGIKSSVIGCATGLIPGPSAFLASLIAYKTAGNNIYKKIVSAETANNSSVIACTIPLFLLGLPINQNTLLFSNIMDIKSITLVEKILQPSIIPELNIIQLVLICCAVSMGIYFWLSTHLIWLYTKFITALHYKLKYIMMIFLTVLVTLDISTADITAYNYLILLFLFSLFGFILKKNKFSPLPFLFALILGDKLIWLYTQYYIINF